MRQLLCVLLTLTFMTGCAAPAPMIDYDPNHNFTQYKTFAFISDHPLLRGEGAEGGSPLIEGRLMQVTENILAARGFTRISDREAADMAIGFTLGGREKIQVNSYPSTYHSSYNRSRWGGWGHGSYYSPQQVDVRQYTEGTLAIDIYDVKEHKPVWHGRATRKITKKMRENPGQTVQEIMSGILATFPPY
jgi:hypothetical protein